MRIGGKAPGRRAPFSPSASVPCHVPVPATSDRQSAVPAEPSRERRIGKFPEPSACRTQDDALQCLAGGDKAPERERECLVGERTRIVNRMKGTLARLGIRNFKPTLRKAAERLATLHTPEGSALPPNVSAELRRDIARLGFVISQIKEIEEARQERLEQEPETGSHAMVRHLARVVGVGIETADMLVNEVLWRPMRDRKAVARYAGLTGSPDESGAKR